MEVNHADQETSKELRREPTQAAVREIIHEFIKAQRANDEPAYKAELLDERRRREQLEQRVNELVDENRQNRQRAEEAERSSAIRSELQRLGVSKIDLAFKILKDEITRRDDGELVARGMGGEIPMAQHLARFVEENPEFLPARIAGGSGVSLNPRGGAIGSASLDLDKIRPGMDQEEMQRMRQEIARIASQTLRGL